MLYRTVIVGILSLGMLGACGNPTAAVPELQLPSKHKILIGKEDSRVFAVKSDTPVYISFAFEVGSGSYDATDNCPELDVGTAEQPFAMELCGEVRDAHAKDNMGGYFQGKHGGGTMFNPVDGYVKVRLTNFAPNSMEYVVTISETMS